MSLAPLLPCLSLLVVACVPAACGQHISPAHEDHSAGGDELCALQASTASAQKRPRGRGHWVPTIVQTSAGLSQSQGLEIASKALLEVNGSGAIAREFNSVLSVSCLPFTIGIFNDLPHPVIWNTTEMTDGHLYSAPEAGSSISFGQMFVLVAYARSNGLAGKVLVKDTMGNSLSVAFQSYRARNWLSGCEALRVRAMKTSDWDKPYKAMCTTSAYGVHKVDDYDVLLTIKDAA